MGDRITAGCVAACLLDTSEPPAPSATRLRDIWPPPRWLPHGVREGMVTGREHRRTRRFRYIAGVLVSMLFLVACDLLPELLFGVCEWDLVTGDHVVESGDQIAI